MTEPTQTILTYTPISNETKDLVNDNKKLEETVLRVLDYLHTLPDTDKRCLSLGVTKIQEAFMWINRGIFKPTRLQD